MMKNLLLLGLAFTAGIGVADAQKARVRVANAIAVPIEGKLDGDAYYLGDRKSQTPSKSHKTTAAGFFGTQIGKTYYDLPSNAASANRIVRNSDGTISASWTETCSTGQSPNFATRGAGYNYFDGTTWIHGAVGPKQFDGTCNETSTVNGPDFGVASVRTGWPEVVVLPSGKEMLFGHATGINVTSRPTKGTGGMAAWSATTDLAFTKNIQGITGNNGTWPRVVSSGNYIHMIYTINNTPVPVINGVTGIIVYSRSSDGGLNWDIQNFFLPGLDAAGGIKQIGGDSYAIAANGANVAITAGDFGDSWSLWKSTDNGTTFTKSFIKQFSTAADTIMITATDTAAFSNDGAHALIIDNSGKIHAFAGGIFVKGGLNAAGRFKPSTSWYPGLGTDPTLFRKSSLLYWNSGMAAGTHPQIIAGIEDSQPDGDPDDFIALNSTLMTPYGTMGLVSMPNAAFDANGNVYVVYTAVVEGASNGGTTGQPYRDMYIAKRTTNGAWSTPINISRFKNIFPQLPGSSAAENGEEDVFPSVAHVIGSDNKLHTVWMTDYEPGMTLGADADPEGYNTISYEAFDLAAFPFVMGLGTSKDVAAFVNNISAFPNPTNGKVSINIDLKKNADVKVRVTNVLGQEVANFAAKSVAAGKNTSVEVDMSNYANGIYLYTVSSNDFTITNRIVKQ
jgi:hypothetical protein